MPTLKERFEALGREIKAGSALLKPRTGFFNHYRVATSLAAYWVASAFSFITIKPENRDKTSARFFVSAQSVLAIFLLPIAEIVNILRAIPAFFSVPKEPVNFSVAGEALLTPVWKKSTVGASRASPEAAPAIDVTDSVGARRASPEAAPVLDVTDSVGARRASPEAAPATDPELNQVYKRVGTILTEVSDFLANDAKKVMQCIDPNVTDMKQALELKEKWRAVIDRSQGFCDEIDRLCILNLSDDDKKKLLEKKEDLINTMSVLNSAKIQLESKYSDKWLSELQSQDLPDNSIEESFRAAVDDSKDELISKKTEIIKVIHNRRVQIDKLMRSEFAKSHSENIHLNVLDDAIFDRMESIRVKILTERKHPHGSAANFQKPWVLSGDNNTENQAPHRKSSRFWRGLMQSFKNGRP